MLLYGLTKLPSRMHGAHGYLLGSFVSPYSNKRTDSYGGSLQNRARLATEVADAIRKALGPTFAIGYRMSAEEYVEGGLEIGEACEFAGMLAASGVDFIDVSGGIYESATKIIQGPHSPRAVSWRTPPRSSVRSAIPSA